MAGVVLGSTEGSVRHRSIPAVLCKLSQRAIGPVGLKFICRLRKWGTAVASRQVLDTIMPGPSLALAVNVACCFMASRMQPAMSTT